MNSAPPTLAVVIPAHQTADEIDACLGGLLAAGFAPIEILVVDDGSRDGTGDRAKTFGVKVLRNESAQGPAEARNRGVAAVDADIVIFVDSDVVVHRDARARILERFVNDPELAALFGSYDDTPPAPSAVSCYRNLLHHYVHQQSCAEASTFWTGLGAVRRIDFLRVGGFTKAWQCVEDVEFGIRLKRSGGSIMLDRSLLGTHLKAWSIGSMFRTDLLGRAIPWTRLVLFHGGPTADLNLTGTHRTSVAMVALFGACVAASVFDARFAILSVLAVTCFVLANRNFLRFLIRRRGLGFAAAALPYHALHYLAAGLLYPETILI